MNAIATPMVDNTTLYGERHGEFRKPAMLGASAASEGMACIIGTDESGTVVGTIVFRTILEIETEDVLVELIMLRCSPERRGYGKVLLTQLKAFYLESTAKDIIGKDIILIAYVVKVPTGSRKFFEDNDFIFDLKGLAKQDKINSASLELLRSLYLALEQRMLRQQNTTRPAWNQRWKEATALGKEAKKLEAKVEAFEQKAQELEEKAELTRADQVWREAKEVWQAANEKRQDADAAGDALASLDFTWNQDHTLNGKNGVQPAMLQLRTEQEDAEEAAMAEAATSAVAKAPKAAKAATEAEADAASNGEEAAFDTDDESDGDGVGGKGGGVDGEGGESDGSDGVEVIESLSTTPKPQPQLKWQPQKSKSLAGKQHQPQPSQQQPSQPQPLQPQPSQPSQSQPSQSSQKSKPSIGKQRQPPPSQPQPSQSSQLSQPSQNAKAVTAAPAVHRAIQSKFAKGFDPLSGYCKRRSCHKVHLSECELTCGHGREIVGRSVVVYWEDDKRWYRGRVNAHRCECELCIDYATEAEGDWHHISYDDGTEQAEILDFSKTCWRFAEVVEEEEAAAVVSEAAGMHLSARSSTGNMGVGHDLRPSHLAKPFQAQDQRDGRKVPPAGAAGSSSMHTADPDPMLTEKVELAKGFAGSFGRGCKRKQEELVVPEPSVDARPTAAERQAASFTYADWCHGSYGGLGLVVGQRCNGLLVCACDTDQPARAAYRDILREAKLELDNAFHLTSMAQMAIACLWPIDLIFAGLPCPAFSVARTVGAKEMGFDYQSGKAIDEFLDTLEARCRAGCHDRAILIEEVCGILRAKGIGEKLARLQRLGFHWRAFTADAIVYGAAIHRKRLALVCFRDEESLVRFGRGPAPTSAGAPLSTVLDKRWNSQPNTPPWLWLASTELMHAAAHKPNCLVVTPSTTEMGVLHTKANSPPIPQGDNGTFVCVDEAVKDQTTRLSEQQRNEYAKWFVHDTMRPPTFRRMHPSEELLALGWRDAELPPASKSVQGPSASKAQYEAVGITVSPSMYTAFAARMLWAINKPLPEGMQINEASEEQVKHQTSTEGVEHTKMLPLKAESSGDV